jgi:hypothetical protein
MTTRPAEAPTRWVAARRLPRPAARSAGRQPAQVRRPAAAREPAGAARRPAKAREPAAAARRPDRARAPEPGVAGARRPAPAWAPEPGVAGARPPAPEPTASQRWALDWVRTSGPRSVRTSGPRSVRTSGPRSVRTSGPRLVRRSGPRSVRTSGPRSVPRSGPRSVRTSGPIGPVPARTARRAVETDPGRPATRKLSPVPCPLPEVPGQIRVPARHRSPPPTRGEPARHCRRQRALRPEAEGCLCRCRHDG